MSGLTEAEEQRDLWELERSLERLCIPNISVGFKREQIPGKGDGIVATTNIQRGTPLTAETAIFSVDDVRDTLSPDNERAIRRHARAASNWQFRELVCTSDPPSDYSRFDTNNFKMGEDERGKRRCGIFIEASRFNHSCIPNAYFAWNPALNNSQGQLTIYAIQDIHAGERILISYRPKYCYKLRDACQAKLNKHYGFTCGCPACLRHPGHPFGAMSDGRRGRIRDLQIQIRDSRDLSTPDQREAKRDNINKLMDNLSQEGIVYPQLAEALDELGKLAYHELSVARGQRDMSAAAYESYCYNSALHIARDKLDLDACCTSSQSPVVMEALEFIRGLDG